jgi:hypothetical protein
VATGGERVSGFLAPEGHLSDLSVSAGQRDSANKPVREGGSSRHAEMILLGRSW